MHGAAPKIPLVVPLLAVGLAVWVISSRVMTIWPLDVHLRDDAYYYFCWARNVMSGNGPCVTEGVWTSGVHVLWALILAPAGIFGPWPEVSVFLGLSFHIATAGLIYGASFPDRRLGVAVGGAYAGAPFLAIEAMNGQETALACFALALFCLKHERAFFWTGLIAVAARSDLIFFVFAMALVEPRLRARRLVAVFSILACYAGWNLILAGHWLQDSAEPIPWLMQREFENSGASYFDKLWEGARPLLLGSRFRLASTPMAFAWFVVVWLGWRSREHRFVWLLGGGLALVCFHDLWRFYSRDYYFAPLGVLGALALVRLVRLRPRLGVVLLLLAIVWSGYRCVRFPVRTFNWQREMTMAGRFVRDVVPGSESMGCFNSGIVTWLNKTHQSIFTWKMGAPVDRHGRVINLDGVVNRRAFDALRRGRLLDYLGDNGIHYLLDNPAQFEQAGVHANGRHFGDGFDAARDLEEVVRFTWSDDEAPRGRHGMEHFSLYRVRKLGEDPLVGAGIQDLGPAPGGRFIRWNGSPGAVLRTAVKTLIRADSELNYVLQVNWSGRQPLRLFVGESKEPALVIAPK